MHFLARNGRAAARPWPRVTRHDRARNRNVSAAHALPPSLCPQETASARFDKALDGWKTFHAAAKKRRAQAGKKGQFTNEEMDFSNVHVVDDQSSASSLRAYAKKKFSRGETVMTVSRTAMLSDGPLRQGPLLEDARAHMKDIDGVNALALFLLMTDPKGEPRTMSSIPLLSMLPKRVPVPVQYTDDEWDMLSGPFLRFALGMMDQSLGIYNRVVSKMTPKYDGMTSKERWNWAYAIANMMSIGVTDRTEKGTATRHFAIVPLYSQLPHSRAANVGPARMQNLTDSFKIVALRDIARGEELLRVALPGSNRQLIANAGTTDLQNPWEDVQLVLYPQALDAAAEERLNAQGLTTDRIATIKANNIGSFFARFQAIKGLDDFNAASELLDLLDEFEADYETTAAGDKALVDKYASRLRGLGRAGVDPDDAVQFQNIINIATQRLTERAHIAKIREFVVQKYEATGASIEDRGKDDL